jgi:uncharacterized membrane protein
MALLILGLVLFLGMHSVRLSGDGFRDAHIVRFGEKAWKAGYSLISVLGLGLIIVGYGQARLEPVVLWASPAALRHLAGLLMLVSLILLVAPYVKGNYLKARLGHPMVLGVKVWALAHLLANNTLADVLLFGGFLVWAVLVFRTVRRRQPPAGGGSLVPTLVTVALGAALWAGFAFWAHQAWIGVRPY